MLNFLLNRNSLGARKERTPSALLSLIILCFLATGAVAADPVFSRTNKFKIPFQFDQVELKKIGANEIQLFVSINRGASWRLHDSVQPDAGKFTYEASEDGEFWFSVRTRTSNGLTYPAGNHEPGLKVIIDTKQPSLSLDLTETPIGGEVELQWNATDDHLIESSLQLEFLDPVQQTWEKVGVRPARQGRTSWSVPKAGLVEVRGRIQDAAGNQAEIATQTIVAGMSNPVNPAQQNARPVAKDAKPQMLANQPLDVGMEIRPKNDSRIGSKFQGTDLILPGDDLLKKTPVTAVSNGNSSTELAPLQKAAPKATPPPLAGDPFSTPPPQPTPPQQTDLFQQPAPPQQKATTQQSTPTQESTQPLQEMPAQQYDSGSKEATTSPKTNEERVEKSKVVDKELVNLQRSLMDATGRTVGHLVNSGTFRIAYELEDVGPSGVSNVELYITEDGGAKWFHYGSDQDRVSPIVATVPRDGQYGFSFRIRNGAGIVATPPQPGDKPEIVITVDQTRPVVKVKSPLQVEGKDKLKIEWIANDLHLDANAVALYYALKAEGPWVLIDGWKPNTNSYTWDVPQGIASQFFLRLDVRDAAGNISRNDVKAPFSIDTAKPTARVIEIEPLQSDPK